MKTNTILPIDDCIARPTFSLPIERQSGVACLFPIGNRQSAIGNIRAFTLIELLTVIAVMAILSALLLPTIFGLKRKQYISMAQAEMAQIGAELEDYKSQYGVYPPSNPLNPMTNTLFYELSGVTNIVPGANTYQTLDNASTVPVADYASASLFGVGGAINCAKVGADAETAKARSFFNGLKANEIGTITDPVNASYQVKLLVTAANPDPSYQPLGPTYQYVNPWRYMYPGINNPNSYDLWIQLRIGGKTNLVCNWTKQAIINSPLP